MVAKRCAEYARLQAAVNTILELIAELTSAQLQAFQSSEQTLFARLDRELENAIGEKERAVGAMRQHAKEHRCQPSMELRDGY